MKFSLPVLFCLTILIVSLSPVIAQPGRQRNDQNNNGTRLQGPFGQQNGFFGNQGRSMNDTRFLPSNQSAMNQQRNGGFGGSRNQNNNQGQQSQQGPQGSQSGPMSNTKSSSFNQSAMGQQQNRGPGGFGNETRSMNDTRALPSDQSGFGERNVPGANLTSAGSESSFGSGFFGHFMVSFIIILLFGFIISVFFYRQELKKNGTAPFAPPSFCPKAFYPAAPLARQDPIEIDTSIKAHRLIEEGEGYDRVL